MTAFQIILLIVGILLFLTGLWALFKNEVLAPLGGYAGLVALYFSHALPLASNMVITWLALTVIVVGISKMQPAAVMAQTRGVGYMLVGAVVGMLVGLIAVSSTDSLTTLYACMIVGVLAGIFFGFMLFTRTPQGANVGLSSGRFFSYLAAKGVPVAAAVIQLGVALLLWLVTIS